MVYVYHNFLIHPPADGHLGYFHTLTIVSSAAMNIRVHVSQFWFSQCVCPAVGLLGRMAVLISSFLRNLHTVLHRGCTSLHSHQHIFLILHFCDPQKETSCSLSNYSPFPNLWQPLVCFLYRCICSEYSM